ncbi:recombinase family protein, partial [Streptomyces sp. NRRL F-525]|uniref:recombinase family protein n=1 Tax=Streptomyces sp. NRRL F-525 TaxID=1463861 RepID=UPI001F22A4F3
MQWIADEQADGILAPNLDRLARELTDDERENAIAEQMERWRDQEGLGVRAIAARANAEGLRSKRGGRWHPTTVARLLSPQAREKAREQSARARAERKEQQLS